MQLHALDIAIIVGYFLTVILIGLWVSRRGAKDMDSYFLGGKTLPWYLLGVSDASGMFDISGTMWLVYILFLYGLKSIWLPWVWPTFNQIFLMMFMSAWLRRSNVLTGARMDPNALRHAARGAHAGPPERGVLRARSTSSACWPTPSRASASSPSSCCRGISPATPTGLFTRREHLRAHSHGAHLALCHQGRHDQRGHHRGHAVHDPDPHRAHHRRHRHLQGLAGHDRPQHSRRLDESVLRLDARTRLDGHP